MFENFSQFDFTKHHRFTIPQESYTQTLIKNVFEGNFETTA
jgi:hypothetical protein